LTGRFTAVFLQADSVLMIKGKSRSIKL